MSPNPSVSRRRFLGAAGALGATGAIGASVAAVLPPTAAGGAVARGAAPTGGAVPFHGAHQAGIVTPAQDRLLFAAFDVVTSDRRALAELLRRWTRMSERMTAGTLVGVDSTDQDAPPDDTGEALGLDPSLLTITIGFGTSLFGAEGRDRFGIAAQRPAPLVDLPPFAGDELQAERSGGDLLVQAASNDPQVAFHAVRNLARVARGDAVLRWSQSGFGRTSSTDTRQATPRNLMGFKDGTNNLKAEDRALVRDQVWVGTGDDPAWMLRGGSYQVTRRIRMLLEIWDRSTLADQEQTIGRVKVSGAPLGRKAEFDPVELGARSGGDLVIAADAHIRLAAPAVNGGQMLLRRGYSFTDGIDPVRGQLDAGLFFIAYQRDPRTQFIPIQQRLAETDALNEYIQHTGSSIAAIPPGVQPGGFVGETLLLGD